MALDCMYCDVAPVYSPTRWGDGVIAPADALSVINDINAGGPRYVGHQHRTDVNWDDHLSSADVLIVINYLNQHEVEADVRVCVGQHDSTGFTDQQVEQGIRQSFQKYTTTFGVTYTFVATSCDLRVQTLEIYLGNGVHAGGRYMPPNLIQLHNGIFGPGHHSGRLAPANQEARGKVYANLGTLTNVAAHEYGHHLGANHIDNRSCLMHPGAVSNTFCSSEEAYFRRVLEGIYGAGPEEVDLLFTP